MVTGVLDSRHALFRELRKDPEPGPHQSLRCCHIFPEALGQSSVSNPAAKVSSPPGPIFMHNDLFYQGVLCRVCVGYIEAIRLRWPLG